MIRKYLVFESINNCWIDIFFTHLISLKGLQIEGAKVRWWPNMYKLDKISSTCGFSKISNSIPLSLTTRQAQTPVGLAKCQAQSIGFKYMLSPNAYKFDMVSNPTPLGLVMRQAQAHVSLTRCQTRFPRAWLHTKLNYTWVSQDARLIIFLHPWVYKNFLRADYISIDINFIIGLFSSILNVVYKIRYKNLLYFYYLSISAKKIFLLTLMLI
jgi:hypothetical protein